MTAQAKQGGFVDFLNILAARTQAAAPKKEGDYIGADGLLYCGQCNTPKQCIPNKEAPNFRPYCLCKCETQKKHELEAQIEANSRSIQIEHNRRTGITDTKILQYTFENDRYPESEVSKRLRRYCANHSAAYENNLGLLLWGRCGVGKSFYAGCVANYLINDGVKVLCTTFPKILNGLFSADDKNEYISDIVAYPFLIIDDLGTERSTEYATEQLFTLIDERYKTNRPTIITTNLNPQDMAAVQAIDQKRIYDRVLEMCTPFFINGEGQRTAAAKAKADKLKDILGG